jgi:anti-sigma factor RsiW
MRPATKGTLAHLWASRRLSALLDGELRGRARGAVERHLADCRACVETLDGLRSAQAVLRAAPRSAPPRGEWDRLRDAMTPAPRTPAGAAPRVPASPGARWAPAAALGLLLGLGASFYYFGVGSHSSAPPAETTSFVTTSDLVPEEGVSLSPSIELLLVARQNGGSSPREDDR